MIDIVEAHQRIQSTYRVAVVCWSDPDENALAICHELEALGHQPRIFLSDQTVPEDVDIVLTFAPYGRFQHIPRQISDMAVGKRPLLIHWNFESIPNINIPWPVLSSLGALRSKVDRIVDENGKLARRITKTIPYSRLNQKMHKFRYLGDYSYAYKDGGLNLLCDSSKIFADLFNSHGLPTMHLPWGIAPSWYTDMNLERDIDVLWMGKWRTRERARLLQKIRKELSEHGLVMYMADNVENPFVFGDVRTRLLNRAKITLNILPTWYDPGFQFRFTKAAANKSLVITDPVLPHVPELEAGKHYVSTPIESLVDSILHYVENEDARNQIVENAYCLVTEEFTLAKSINSIVDAITHANYTGIMAD